MASDTLEAGMTKYAVITPEYDYVLGPSAYLPDDAHLTEPGCDYVEVEASSLRHAKVLAVRQWRLEGTQWVKDQQSNNASPFTGLKVVNLDKEEIANG